MGVVGCEEVSGPGPGAVGGGRVLGAVESVRSVRRWAWRGRSAFFTGGEAVWRAVDGRNG